MIADTISIKPTTNGRSRRHLETVGLFWFTLTREISVLMSPPLRRIGEGIPSRCTTRMLRSDWVGIVRIGHWCAGIFGSGSSKKSYLPVGHAHNGRLSARNTVI